jgi:GNAT superfamily N-acetyltransferase
MTGSGELPPICSYLEWDSKFFEKRIARLNRRRLDDRVLAESEAWCHSNRIDCLYFLADSDHPQTPPLATSHNFLFTDIRVTLETRIASKAVGAFPPGIRFGKEEDLTILRSIARSGHRDSRFYFDPNFDRGKCDLLYETWIENSFRGFANAVLVADDGGPAAYLTCRLKGQETQIGLIGVGEAHRGKGLGAKLLEGFHSWSQDQGATRATVVTQGRNLQAQRLYQRNGYVTVSVELWYHRWFVR